MSLKTIEIFMLISVEVTPQIQRKLLTKLKQAKKIDQNILFKHLCLFFFFIAYSLSKLYILKYCNYLLQHSIPTMRNWSMTPRLSPSFGISVAENFSSKP